MSYQPQNRRAFLKNTGKAGIAIAASPIIGKMNFAAAEFKQQGLPYAYDALEPFIDKMTMEIHYTKHAAAYATNLNDACTAEKVDIASTSLVALLQKVSKYSTKMRNNAGGHFNHEFFWQLMKPAPATQPSGALAEAINVSFGNLEEFKKQFGEAAKARFGSGWAWLIVNAEGKLAITSTANQDNPLMDIVDVKGTPIIGLDVWEHAYYLKYQNKRADYINNWWNIVNWAFAEKQFANATKK